MKRHLFILIWLIAFGLGAGATNYVVCVGISNYPGTSDDLRVSANDANTMAKLYRANGGCEVVKLTDSNATRAKVISQLNALFTKATSADRIVLFFSGHGMPGYFLCYDGLLSYKQIVEVMRRSKASCKMVMADACFSGKMRSSKQRGKKYSSKDVMFFLSSRSNEPSKESSFSNSVFTIYLERGLRGGADKNKDRVITARELYEFVHKGVIGATDNSQHPVMWGNFNDNMVILKWR